MVHPEVGRFTDIESYGKYQGSKSNVIFAGFYENCRSLLQSIDIKK